MTVYGDFKFTSGSVAGGTVYCSANAYISHEDDYGVTVTVTAGAHLVSGAYVLSSGVVAKLIVNGEVVSTQTVLGNGTRYDGPDWREVSADWIVFKTRYAQTISVGVAFYEYVDGREIGWRLHLTPDFLHVDGAFAEPNAPTLNSPSSGQVFGVTAGTATSDVTLAFTHNPVDGTAQTAAEIRYRPSASNDWTTVTLGSEASTTATLATNADYIWQARTKGTADGYGPWSGTQTFSVYEVPSLTLGLSPLEGGAISGMPVSYEVGYLDMGGTFAAGTIAVLDGSGSSLYTEQLPETQTVKGSESIISGTISMDELLLEDGGTYTFQVSARSSDSLTASASGTYLVAIDGEPSHGILEVENDPETGYVSLVVGWDASTGTDTAISASVYRLNADGSRVLLAGGLANGSTVLDPYAPLNSDYSYIVVTRAATSATYTAVFPNRLVSNRFFAYWRGNIAWASWNPQGSYGYDHPGREHAHYAGARFPVGYSTAALDFEADMSFLVTEGRDAWEQLAFDGGRGVYKGADGRVFRADFTVTWRSDHTTVTPYDELSVHVKRIGGGSL